MKVGDKVRIIKYGSLMWINKQEWKNMLSAGIVTDEIPKNCIGECVSIEAYMVDVYPELVGLEGTIDKIDIVQGKSQFALKGVSKYAWYFKDQLELIT